MKPLLILVSHGQYAAELLRSAEMIMGHIEGIHTVAMLDDDGMEGTRKKLESVVEKLEHGQTALIAADLQGGTPCNVAVQAMFEHDGLRVITGLNLPMAIEYAVSDTEDVDELASYLAAVGKEAVQTVEKPATNNGEEGYED